MCSGNPSHCSKTSRRIECLLLTLFLTVQLEFALALLPAPVNISVNSINFDHSLLWDPGPGTPPGTQYKIFKWKNGNGKLSKVRNILQSFTLENLEQGAEYCVQVHMNTNLNKNIDPSTLKCILTSPPQTSGSKHLLLGCWIHRAQLSIIIPFILLFFLQPFMFQKLLSLLFFFLLVQTTPSQYKDTFTPKRAISDCITITSDKGNGKAVERQTLIIFPAAIMEPNSEMENVREEDRSSCYLNKNFQLSLSENSSSGFGPLLDSNNAILEKNLQQIDFKVKSDVEEPVVHLIDTCFHTEDQNPSEQNYEGVKNEEEGELWNNTLNVNLLSVTIAAPVIEIREMEDEDTEPNSTDFSTIQTMETSFAQDSYLKRTLAIP
uniref:Interferon alpha/beta receptor 2-like n=1 Tax=Gouania willdenowi TaxID=441366 RepID=A0A8C5G6Y2_GOUWI